MVVSMDRVSPIESYAVAVSVSPDRPHVVIIGGFLTEPLFYRPMRSRLLATGAERVTIAGIHLPDWLALPFAGMGPVSLRGARAIRDARRASPAPLIVIGHSAGGIVARLAMSTVPFERRVTGVADDVGCLVTLGTPHRLLPSIPFWRHPGVRATEFLERVSPGTHLAPRCGYLTVGSSLVPPEARRVTNPARSIVNRMLRPFIGAVPGASGDGIIDDELSRLDGARHVELPDVLHGTFGGPWYGDAEVIERWWPAAVAAWHSAIVARARPVSRPEEPEKPPLEGSSPAAPLARSR
jgi:hypothetical protein